MNKPLSTSSDESAPKYVWVRLDEHGGPQLTRLLNDSSIEYVHHDLFDSLQRSNRELRAALESVRDCKHIYRCGPCGRIAAAALKEV